MLKLLCYFILVTNYCIAVLLCVQHNVKLCCLFLSWFAKEANVAHNSKRLANERRGKLQVLQARKWRHVLARAGLTYRRTIQTESTISVTQGSCSSQRITTLLAGSLWWMIPVSRSCVTKPQDGKQIIWNKDRKGLSALQCFRPHTPLSFPWPITGWLEWQYTGKNPATWSQKTLSPLKNYI